MGSTIEPFKPSPSQPDDRLNARQLDPLPPVCSSRDGQVHADALGKNRALVCVQLMFRDKRDRWWLNTVVVMLK